jgi:hypothetical protein
VLRLQGSGLCDLKPDRCVAFDQIDSYLEPNGRSGIMTPSMPILYLPAIAPYIPDRVIDHGSDSPVESFIIHLPSIGQAEHHYYGEVTAMFHIFLSNITMYTSNLFLP